MNVISGGYYQQPQQQAQAQMLAPQEYQQQQYHQVEAPPPPYSVQNTPAPVVQQQLPAAPEQYQQQTTMEQAPQFQQQQYPQTLEQQYPIQDQYQMAQYPAQALQQPGAYQQQFYQPTQPYFPPTQNSYFEKNETLFPDFNTYPEQSDLQAPYTVYNLNRSAQVAPYQSDFHVYEPFKKALANAFPQNVNTEEILRKNEHLWTLYQTGRFEIVQNFDSREKKIILREKTDLPDQKFTIKKFKVPFANTSGAKEILEGRSAKDQHEKSSGGGIKEAGKDDDGHILLVSFSNSQIEPNQHIQVDQTHYTYDEVVSKHQQQQYQYQTPPAVVQQQPQQSQQQVHEHVVRAITTTESIPGHGQGQVTHHQGEEQKIVGPGSGLVARLVEGNSSFSQSGIFDDEDHEEEEEKKGEDKIESEEEGEEVDSSKEDEEVEESEGEGEEAESSLNANDTTCTK